MEYRRAFENMGMPPSKYAIRYALPIVALGVVLAIPATIYVGRMLPAILTPVVPIVFIGFAAGVAVMGPMTLMDRRRTQINNALPFFMTHLGVLSTTNIPRAEIFHQLGDKKEYKALSEDVSRIYGLVTNWNLSLPQACRFVSKSTPSQIWADFLERLAHAFETGQDLESFMRNEQSVVMKEYSTVYETAIYQVEQWKDLYTSVIMSGIFFVIFAIITPILGDLDPAKLLMGVLVFFLVMELLLYFVLRIRVPQDRLWHELDIDTPERSRIRVLVLGAALGTSVLLVLLPTLLPLPLGFTLAIAITPLAAAGIYARRVEQHIKRREDNYAAFIRSVGATTAARGGSIREVVRKVKAHNYGPLTSMVHNLYARLSWRLHDDLAWKRFSAESGSNLVEEFNDMFVEGIQSGGKPDRVGEIISENVTRILNLRKSRYSAASTFRGMLLGLTASMAFTLFVGVGILNVMGHMFANVPETPQGLNPLSFNFSVDTSLVEALLLWMILFHCLMASLMLKLVDGGRYPAGLAHFVILVWIGISLAFLSGHVMSAVFGISTG